MEDVEKSWEYQYYPSPGWLIKLMILRAQVSAHDIILEPSAGDGRVLEALRAHTSARTIIECCELMPEHRARLMSHGWDVVANDFLDLDRYARYTRIIANPPFTRGQDIEHIKHMYRLLCHGGRMVSLMSAHYLDAYVEPFVSFREWLDEEVMARQEVLSRSAFKELGIDVKTVLITIDK